jgi:hypothetical protein
MWIKRMAGEVANHAGGPSMLAVFAFSTTIGIRACQIPFFPIEMR